MVTDISERYLKNVVANDKLKRAKDKLICEIKSKEIELSKQLLRSSLIFNDHTFISTTGDGELSLKLLEKKALENYFNLSDFKFHIPVIEIEKQQIDPSNLECVPAFLTGASDEFKLFIDEIESLIDSNKVIYEPERLAVISDKTSPRPKHFHALKIIEGCPWDSWQAIEDTGFKESLELVKDNSSVENEEQLFEVTIPFIEGVPFSDLQKMLEDEQDALILLRKSLKETVKLAQEDKKTAVDIINDDLKPKISTINTRFNKIISTYRIRVGAASVGTLGLSLISIYSAGASTIPAALLGAGGLGWAAKEYSDYIEKKNELKEDPYYFLWKVKNRA